MHVEDGNLVPDLLIKGLARGVALLGAAVPTALLSVVLVNPATASPDTITAKTCCPRLR